MIDLGKTLGLRVAAEGIENEQQLHFLRQHGCAACQGCLLGKPMGASQFEAEFLGIGAKAVVAGD